MGPSPGDAVSDEVCAWPEAPLPPPHQCSSRTTVWPLLNNKKPFYYVGVWDIFICFFATFPLRGKTRPSGGAGSIVHHGAVVLPVGRDEAVGALAAEGELSREEDQVLPVELPFQPFGQRSGGMRRVLWVTPRDSPRLPHQPFPSLSQCPVPRVAAGDTVAPRRCSSCSRSNVSGTANDRSSAIENKYTRLSETNRCPRAGQDPHRKSSTGRGPAPGSSDSPDATASCTC